MLVCLFQAEGGKRVAQESRGRGNVYKRRIHRGGGAAVLRWPAVRCSLLGEEVGAVVLSREWVGMFWCAVFCATHKPVPSTHLTLPTKEPG